MKNEILKKVSLMLQEALSHLDNEDVMQAKNVLLLAEKTLQKLSKTDDETNKIFFDIYLLLAECFCLTENFNIALSYATYAKQIFSSDCHAGFVLSKIHYHLGETKKALFLLQPLFKKQKQAHYYYQLALILTALGPFSESKKAFAKANKLDSSLYKKPSVISEKELLTIFAGVLLKLPKEIRDFIQNSSVLLFDIPPLKLVRAKKIKVNSLVFVDSKNLLSLDSQLAIAIFVKNIKNFCDNKREIFDVLSSALIHEITKHKKTPV